MSEACKVLRTASPGRRLSTSPRHFFERNTTGTMSSSSSSNSGVPSSGKSIKDDHISLRLMLKTNLRFWKSLVPSV